MYFWNTLCNSLHINQLGQLAQFLRINSILEQSFQEGINPNSNGGNLVHLKRPGYYAIDFSISCHVMLLINGKRTVSEWEEKLFVSIAGVASHPIPLCATAATSMREANKRPLRPHGSLLIRTRHNMHSSIKDGRPSELLLTSRDCEKSES